MTLFVVLFIVAILQPENNIGIAGIISSIIATYILEKSSPLFRYLI